MLGAAGWAEAERTRRVAGDLGQAIMEYALLLGIVTAAILGMQLFAKRGIQAGVKTMADRLSPHASDPSGELAQRDGIRYESRDRTDKVVGVGSVLSRRSQTRATADQTITTAVVADGSATTAVTTDATATRGILTGSGIGPDVSDRSEVVVNVH